jgi:hypothetical protein
MRQNADVMHGMPISHSTEPSTRGIACQVENISMILICKMNISSPEYWRVLAQFLGENEKIQFSDSP